MRPSTAAYSVEESSVATGGRVEAMGYSERVCEGRIREEQAAMPGIGRRVKTNWRSPRAARAIQADSGRETGFLAAALPARRRQRGRIECSRNPFAQRASGSSGMNCATCAL